MSAQALVADRRAGDKFAGGGGGGAVPPLAPDAGKVAYP
jgi:hypothetical protein